MTYGWVFAVVAAVISLLGLVHAITLTPELLAWSILLLALAVIVPAAGPIIRR